MGHHFDFLYSEEGCEWTANVQLCYKVVDPFCHIEITEGSPCLGYSLSAIAEGYGGLMTIYYCT